MVREQFSVRLRQLRQQHGEKRGDLADLLDVGVSQISEMENGRKGTTMERLALLCVHYNISADYLLGLTDEARALRPED
ncbi:MAG TPA: helix-turn-helix transcriptional regulator [Candidatus Flavonifractor intestinipullorum]|uniref:Helix-turn-helix transcriptional regulator n=1 Tax=Candidatus Flavonifractor intestinipullorum TaxID=2838587 RepID=A0A9D2M9T3_9FIRM|nr:helix-turn-helix transcriptional regulator [Candidatus Flavonifractor intestinipullorum]